VCEVAVRMAAHGPDGHTSGRKLSVLEVGSAHSVAEENGLQF
jgi:hypothetical protein